MKVSELLEWARTLHPDAEVMFNVTLGVAPPPEPEATTEG